MTDLKCSTCGKLMPQTAVPADKAWCSDECYEKRNMNRLNRNLRAPETHRQFWMTVFALVTGYGIYQVIKWGIVWLT